MPDKPVNYRGQIMKMFFYNASRVTIMAVQLFFYTACHQKTASHITTNTSNYDTLYSFDITKKSVIQSYDPGTMGAFCKFLQVEVSKVINPKKHSVTFELHYQTDSAEKIFLGSFGLYPSDNPGKFIVPTGGKVNQQGSIILSLILPAEVSSRDTLNISVKKITCRGE